MRETLSSLKKELEDQKRKTDAEYRFRLEMVAQKEFFEKENEDLKIRLAHADKVNLANIGLINFLKGQVSVFELIHGVEECDCDECLSDNHNNQC